MRRSGVTTRQIAEAANAAHGGIRVVYLAANVKHASYCADIARDVVGCERTKSRFRVLSGAGDIVFAANSMDPWPLVSGHREVVITFDHATPFMSLRGTGHAWADAIQYAAQRKGTTHDDDTRFTPSEREHPRPNLWRKVLRFFAKLGGTLRGRKDRVRD